MNLPDGSKPSDLRTLLRSEVALSRYSTFQIGGTAQYFSEPACLEEVQTLLDFARNEDLPFLVIGKGSNVLFPEEGFPGLVITLIHFNQRRIDFDVGRSVVTASAGVNLYKLAIATRDACMGGLEFLSHVPGTLGGALVMNAGFSRFSGQKKEIGGLVEGVTVINSSGEIVTLGREGLDFKYRQTNLDGIIVLEAKLKLYPAKRSAIQSEIQANFSYRNGVQDLRYPSAGSVFKNPEGKQGSSGQLIDQIGLKGTRIGGAMISDRHANFIVNLGGARSSDVVDLIRLAQDRVFEEFGVHLEPEIRIIPSPEELVSVPR